jgi:hypothetical protein
MEERERVSYGEAALREEVMLHPEREKDAYIQL